MLDVNAPLQLSRSTVLWRGVMERCPHCGQGKLYLSYLKPFKICKVCTEDLSTIRADDGPAWLTVMVTGHLVVPLAITLALHDWMQPWQTLLLLLVLTFALVFLLLPRAKSIFIGMIWLAKKRPVVGNGKYDQIGKAG